jgi:OOP family OmpA-OmpF porin
MPHRSHAEVRIRTLALAACGAMLLASCATRTTVVLLPEKDGGATSIVVRDGHRQVVLDRPYAAADLTLADPWLYNSDPQDVQSRFGATLAAQPSRPAEFTLYFIEGSDELTFDSKQLLERVSAEIAQRPVPDVVVVGHTDSVGSASFNDALARQRADSVRAALIQRGVPAESVVAAGRGKREPLVPTPDGVAEPRNRRVEVLVR